MEFVLLSIPGSMMGEIESYRELLDLGLPTYHIRKPDFTKEQVQNVLNLIPTKYRKNVVLHGHPELVKKYELKGIHHNSQSQYIPDLGAEFTQSKSFHRVEDIAADQNPYDYVFLSPIFDSISKANYPSNFDLETLELPQNQNIYALGGVEPEHIELLKTKGFKGYAVLGGVWSTIVYHKMIAKFHAYMEGRKL